MTAPSLDRVASAARLFRAMGDPGRLGVLAVLVDGELSVGEIAAALGHSLSAISQRLRLLEADGLVRRRRDGRHTYVALADAHVERMVVDGLAHGGE